MRVCISFTEVLNRLTKAADKMIKDFSIWMTVADDTVWGIDSSNILNPLNKALWLLVSEAENTVIN